jgi:hypothetical protein
MCRILFLILVVMSSISFGQFKQKDVSLPQKFDEFENLVENEWKARLDRVEVQLRSSDLRGFIIVYAELGKERTSIDKLEKQYLDYLVNIKGLSRSKVFTSPGGFRKSQTTEIWLLPDGAALPDATPDEKFKPEKFAEVEKVSDDEFKKQIGDFFVKLQSDPNSQGYIIIYGSDEEVAGREKLIRDSISFRCYDASRITLVRGGDIGKLKTVFWIVPPGAENPTP